MSKNIINTIRFALAAFIAPKPEALTVQVQADTGVESAINFGPSSVADVTAEVLAPEEVDTKALIESLKAEAVEVDEDECPINARSKRLFGRDIAPISIQEGGEEYVFFPHTYVFPFKKKESFVSQVQSNADAVRLGLNGGGVDLYPDGRCFGRAWAGAIDYEANASFPAGGTEYTINQDVLELYFDGEVVRKIFNAMMAWKNDPANDFAKFPQLVVRGFTFARLKGERFGTYEGKRKYSAQLQIVDWAIVDGDSPDHTKTYVGGARLYIDFQVKKGEQPFMVAKSFDDAERKIPEFMAKYGYRTSKKVREAFTKPAEPSSEGATNPAEGIGKSADAGVNGAKDQKQGRKKAQLFGAKPQDDEPTLG